MNMYKILMKEALCSKVKRWDLLLSYAWKIVELCSYKLMKKIKFLLKEISFPLRLKWQQTEFSLFYRTWRRTRSPGRPGEGAHFRGTGAHWGQRRCRGNRRRVGARAWPSRLDRWLLRRRRLQREREREIHIRSAARLENMNPDTEMMQINQLTGDKYPRTLSSINH